MPPLNCRWPGGTVQFADVSVILSLMQHAYKDGTVEEVKLRHLASADGATVIAKDIRYGKEMWRIGIGRNGWGEVIRTSFEEDYELLHEEKG